MFSSTVARCARIQPPPALRVCRPDGRRCLFYPSAPMPSGPPIEKQPFQKTSLPHLGETTMANLTSNLRTMGRPANQHFDDLVGPSVITPSSLPQESSPHVRWANLAQKKGFIPLDPYAGRTVDVKGYGSDTLTKAWNKLNGILRENNVRKELRLTARHEQKGEKRRRLQRERWRRKFADEVRKKVSLAMRIKFRERMARR